MLLFAFGFRLRYTLGERRIHRAAAPQGPTWEVLQKNDLDSPPRSHGKTNGFLVIYHKNPLKMVGFGGPWYIHVYTIPLIYPNHPGCNRHKGLGWEISDPKNGNKMSSWWWRASVLRGRLDQNNTQQPPNENSRTLTSWWLNQPSWKIFGPNWIIPQVGLKTRKYLKPPRSWQSFDHTKLDSFCSWDTRAFLTSLPLLLPTPGWWWKCQLTYPPWN